MLPFYEIQPEDIMVIRNHRELSFPTHIHRYVEILYTISGVQHLSINNIDYEIPEGNAAMIFPNILHEYYQAGKRSADSVILMCEPKVFGGFFPDFNKHSPVNPLITKEVINKDVVYAFKAISKYDSNTTKIGWAYIIMSHLLTKINVKLEKRVPIQDVVYKIVNYISLNFNQPITLDSLSKDLNISKYYISHIFSDKLKMNFRTYLGLIRLEYATKLIHITNDTLTTISSNAGFESQRTFNRIFRSVYNMSPREYRDSTK